MKKNIFLLVIIGLFGCSKDTSSEKKYDLILSGGTVVDGLGNPSYRADIAVKGDKIASISKEGFNQKNAQDILDVSGRVVSPGFIDNHAHIQTTIHEHPLAENFTRQGITTILATLHSGDQPWPLDEYAASLQVVPNVGFYAGHTWTRKQVLGLENRAPSADELDKMRWYVEESMKQGAIGFTTGLLYVPANFSKPEEVIELAKVASRLGGIYVSHMRNEATDLLKSVRETVRVGKEARIPAQINHHKAAGVSQWGWSEKSLAIIDSARNEGIDIVHDLYPYTCLLYTSDAADE